LDRLKLPDNTNIKSVKVYYTVGDREILISVGEDKVGFKTSIQMIKVSKEI